MVRIAGRGDGVLCWVVHGHLLVQEDHGLVDDTSDDTLADNGGDTDDGDRTGSEGADAGADQDPADRLH